MIRPRLHSQEMYHLPAARVYFALVLNSRLSSAFLFTAALLWSLHVGLGGLVMWCLLSLRCHSDAFVPVRFLDFSQPVRPVGLLSFSHLCMRSIRRHALLPTRADPCGLRGCLAHGVVWQESVGPPLERQCNWLAMTPP